MQARVSVFLVMCGLLLTPHFIFASVVINEVLFDPTGTDTGLEKIELYNPDGAAADMSNWELYPAGIGYFVFPGGFSLPSGSFVTIHLRASGTDDAVNLHHPSASGNMGNSSGSIVLFRPGGRSADTIVDFVRYHKPGSSESKTWEPAAAAAGLWVTGQYVDVGGIVEGASIGLAADGVRGGTAAWKIFTSPSLGGANGGGAAAEGTEQATSTASATLPELPSEPAPPLHPNLSAEAGPDTTVVAGAILLFRGMAFGFDGEALASARFLWNFGDGVVQEGKSLTHVYVFPGTYRAGLFVSSGEYTGSDWRTVKVLAPDLIISEVRGGADGFVELFNASLADLDIAGMNLTDETRTIFRVPAGTMVGSRSAIVFPNTVTGLNPCTSLVLRDARASILDETQLPGPRADGSSWERAGGTFILQPKPTPGTFAVAAAPRSAAIIAGAPAAGGAEPGGTLLSGTVGGDAGASATVTPPAGAAPRRTFAALVTGNLFFASSIVLGALAAAAFVALKRMGS